MSNTPVLGQHIPGMMYDSDLVAISALATTIPPGGSMIEVGSLVGKSTYCWARSVHPNVRVYAIDLWDDRVAGVEGAGHGLIKCDMNAFLQNTSTCPNVHPIRGQSPDDFVTWNETVDLVFLDDDHDAETLHKSMNLWWKYIRAGGILCGHDFGSPVCPGVKQGVMLFQQQHGIDFRLIGGTSIWVIQKP